MYTANAKITIDVPAAKVWQALTDPKLVKEYLFGTTVVSDWKEGSPITYKGEWEGKLYEDKGKIIKIEPNKLLESIYFSSFSGLEDIPENYQKVIYALSEVEGKTTLTITQEDNKDQAAADRSAENWKMILQGMKSLLEQ